MKTILIEQPGKIRISETAMPKPKEGEALLKIRYCGICGADVASYTGNQPFTTYPRIPGHEFSAEIVSIPENPLGLKAGDVVTANPYFNCGRCYSCQRGYALLGPLPGSGPTFYRKLCSFRYLPGASAL